MIKSIGIHSDSWCLIFPHPKESILNDINNYVLILIIPFLQQQLFTHSQIEAAIGQKTHRFVSLAPYTVCKGTDHLEKIFQDIMDQGGEGIILRDPSTPFETGRSKGFLKHKVFH